MQVYKNILKHSGIYAVGQVLSRCMSFVLLPIYTRYLLPADYGCIAIIDLMTAMVAILVGGGISIAINRFHFDAESESQRDMVWWTGLTIALVATVAGSAPLLLIGSDVERILLGPESRGGVFLALALPTLWLNLLIDIFDNHLRVYRRSVLSVSFSLGRLLVNVGLNVTFLVGLGMGPIGVLLGNLVTAAIMSLVLGAVFLTSRGPFGFDPQIGFGLWRFGRPLVLTSLLSVVMHQSDRYLLRIFTGTEAVGIYALAYAIGGVINSLLLIPFAMIWRVEIFEIAKLPDSKRVFGKVFEYTSYAVMLASLAFSLLSRPIIGVMADGNYAEAAGLIPIICLAYVLFSLHEHFKVPAILAKRTVSLLPAFIFGSVVNFCFNFFLIPRFGASGAAWATVATFATFSAIGLWFYRQIDRYEYPIFRFGCVLIGMATTYVLCEAAHVLGLPTSGMILLSVTVWVIWAIVLYAPILPQCWKFLKNRLTAPAERMVTETV